MRLTSTSARDAAPMWAVVCCSIALATAVAIAATAGASDTLPKDVATALRAVDGRVQGAGDTPGMTIVHIDRPPAGVGRGIQLALFALLFGGPPIAVLAAILRRSKRLQSRSDEWSTAFFAGFAFQLSSVVLTTLLLALIMWSAYESPVHDLVWPTTLLAVAVAIGVWGVRSWRLLQVQGDGRQMLRVSADERPSKA